MIPEVGKLYKVVHLIPPQRKARFSILRFMHETPTHYIFDARPLAGTQSLPKDCVISISPTISQAVKLALNERM